MAVPSFGRLNASRVAGAGDVIRQNCRVAPRLLRGDIPRKSVDISRFRNPRFRNQWIGSCFPAGTPVRMADGTEKPIEAIQVGDRVVTHAHGARRVTRVFQRAYTGPLVSVLPRGHAQPLRATADHAFASPSGEFLAWIPAGELTRADWLIQVPREVVATCLVTTANSTAGNIPACPAGHGVGIDDLTTIDVVELPVYDIEVEEDHSFLAAGIVVHNCVGQSGAAMGETTIRTPDKFDDSTPPNPAINLSPVWVYSVARRYSIDQGINLGGGDGAIVTHGLLAVKQHGFIDWDAWPCTQETERAFRDKVVPDAAKNAKKYMPIQDVAILEAQEQVLEYMAGGFSVWIGVSWPNGATQTRADGYFDWSGRSVGGHAVELLGYDLDKDIVIVGNSWELAKWGGWKGLKNVGYTKWSALSRELSTSKLKNFSSEATVVANVDGWQPKVWDWNRIF